MRDVMHSYGSFGLAAPQIGVPLSIFMVEFSENVNEEFSPDIRKSHEMAIIPFKVSSSHDSLPSFDHSNICILPVMYLWRGTVLSFITWTIIRIRLNHASFTSQL
jgi:hypothetical protein